MMMMTDSYKDTVQTGIESVGLNRRIFKRFFKIDKYGVSTTVSERPFHTRAAATQNTPSPTVFSLV